MEAMRKSLSPALSTCDSLSTARVFGVPLEELQQDGQPGQEVPVLVKRIVEYIEEHGECTIRTIRTGPSSTAPSTQSKCSRLNKSSSLILGLHSSFI